EKSRHGARSRLAHGLWVLQNEHGCHELRQVAGVVLVAAPHELPGIAGARLADGAVEGTFAHVVGHHAEKPVVVAQPVRSEVAEGGGGGEVYIETLIHARIHAQAENTRGARDKLPDTRPLLARIRRLPKV